MFVMLIGHGGAADGSDAKFNLVGPDLSVDGMERAAEADRRAHLAFVDATSASFPFLAGLAAPGRVDHHGDQQRGPEVPHGLCRRVHPGAHGHRRPITDKNGRISLLEAFVYATQSHEAVTTSSAACCRPSTRSSTTPARASAHDATAISGAAGTVAGLTYLDAVGRADVQRSRGAAAAAAPARADRPGRRPAPAAAVDDAGGVRPGIREADHRALAGLARDVSDASESSELSQTQRHPTSNFGF